MTISERQRTSIGLALDAAREAVAMLSDATDAESRARSAARPEAVTPEVLRDVTAEAVTTLVLRAVVAREKAGAAVERLAALLAGINAATWCEYLALLARVHVGLAHGVRMMSDELGVQQLAGELEHIGETREEDAAPLSTHERDTSRPPSA